MKRSSPVSIWRAYGGLALACVATMTAPATSAQRRAKPDRDGTLVAGELGEALDAAARKAGGEELWGSVLVARDGDVLLAKGYGKADYEETDCTPLTLFELASASKQITAAAILHLEQRRKLKVRDTLGEFFDDVPDDKASITLHQLVTHSSGISGNVGVPYASPLTRRAYVKQMLSEPLASQPGERFEYANVNYALLAAVVEEVTDGDFEEYVEKYLFAPAKMSDSGFIGDRDLIKSGRAANRWNEGPSNESAADWHWGWGYRGMGGVVTTVWDVHRWDRALRGTKVLKKKALEKLFEPELEGYAYGWRIGVNRRGTKVASHGGSVAGFGASVLRGLQDDYLVVVLSNDPKLAREVGVAAEQTLLEGR